MKLIKSGANNPTIKEKNNRFEVNKLGK